MQAFRIAVPTDAENKQIADAEAALDRARRHVSNSVQMRQEKHDKEDRAELKLLLPRCGFPCSKWAYQHMDSTCYLRNLPDPTTVMSDGTHVWSDSDTRKTPLRRQTYGDVVDTLAKTLSRARHIYDCLTTFPVCISRTVAQYELIAPELEIVTYRHCNYRPVPMHGN